MSRSLPQFLPALTAAALLCTALAVGSVPAAPRTPIPTSAESIVTIAPAATSTFDTSAEPSRIPSTIGRLISNGKACSATIVTSESRSVVVTAAHCVYNTGGYHLDGAEFVPGYHDGQTPYGVWQVEAAWTPAAWQDGQGRLSKTAPIPDSSHDVAFLRLRPNAAGQRAEDVLGSQGISFSTAPVGRSTTVLGYPGVGKYDGERVQSCSARTYQTRFETGVQTVAGCDFTAGASGGPWISGSSAEGGYVAGVTSAASTDPDRGSLFLVESHFGAEAESVYAAADGDQR